MATHRKYDIIPSDVTHLQKLLDTLTGLPATQLQSRRGSVKFISVYPGDPSTPGYPSYENSTRMDAVSIPRIPSLLISAATARRLFEEIEDGGGNRTIKLVNHGKDFSTSADQG